MEQLIVSLGGSAMGLAVAWYWIKSLREDMAAMRKERQEEIKCLTEEHDRETVRLQERLDRMNERQDVLFRRALAKTDLKDSGRGLPPSD